MTTNNTSNDTRVSDMQTKIKNTLTDLDNRSVIGLVWETVRNTLGLSTIASRLLVLIGVSEITVLHGTYVQNRLESLGDSNKTSNKWFD